VAAWLAYFWSDWEIPWVGIASVLAGAGSLLSGIAAITLARRKGREEAEK
jgi:hypothetical protein